MRIVRIGQSCHHFNACFRIDSVDPDVIKVRIRRAAHGATDHEVAPQGRRFGRPVTHTEKITARRLVGCGDLVADPTDRLVGDTVEIRLAVAVSTVLRGRRNPKLPVGVPLRVVRAAGRRDDGVEVPDVAAIMEGEVLEYHWP